MAADAQPVEIMCLETGHWTMLQPTHHLRWSKSGVLQQAWTRTTYDALGMATGQYHEWRDVPTEQE